MKTPFQYSLLRYFHDHATGEFQNVGLVIYSKEANYFKAELLTKYRRITHAFPGTNGEYFRKYIEYLQRALDTLEVQLSDEPNRLLKNQYPEDLGKLLASVLPVDDDSIQFSESWGGATDDIEATFSRMYWDLVEQYIEPKEKDYRDDNQVWRVFRRPLVEQRVLQNLKKHLVATKVEVFEFDHAWENGHWNALKPLSFDLINPGSIRSKARAWLGAMHVIDDFGELGGLIFLLGHPRDKDNAVNKAFDDAREMLSSRVDRLEVTLVDEEEADKFAKEISQKITI